MDNVINRRKSTTVLTGVLVALMLLATAGAVTAGFVLTSETDIDQNTIDDQYIVIQVGDNTALQYNDLLNAVSFNTTNTGGTVTYSLNLNYDSDNSGANDSAIISQAGKTIRVNETNMTGTFTLTVTVSAFTPIAGLHYWLKVGNANAVDVSAGTWTVSNLAYDEDLALVLYVTGTPTADPGETIGFTNYDSTTNPVTTGSVFHFLAQSSVESTA